MIKKIFKSKAETKRGYTLLFAVITATIVLGVALFIVSSSRKQFLLASTARESMFSIYAADSGIECALESYNGPAAQLDADNPSAHLLDTTATTLSCKGIEYSVKFNSITPEAHSGFSGTTYQSGDTYVDLGSNQCADVIITSGKSEHGTSDKVQFESRGYNLCKLDNSIMKPDLGNARTVERAIRLKYLSCTGVGACVD